MRISDWSSDVCSSDLRGFKSLQPTNRGRNTREWWMFGALAKKLFGSANDRAVKGYIKTVQAINDLEPEISGLTDAQLQAKTAEFKQRVADGRSEEHTSELQSPMRISYAVF